MEQQDKDFTVQYAAMTDTGRKKAGNEDRCYCANLWDDRHILAMAVDGVGGYAGGEIAARIAVEETAGYLEHYRNGERSQLLAEALVHANNTIFRQRFSEDRLYRMCCVMTVALFDLEKGCIYMAHVGDTRMYAHSGGRIIKLSHDHSPVGRDEEMGYLTEIEAMENPFRNIVEKAVGEQPLDNATDFVETNVFPMGNGITWMLCSDGLTDMITSANISLILDSDGTLESKAQELIDAANDAGGKDNITVVLVSSTARPDGTTVQVMDDYARNVLPPRPAEEETQPENPEPAESERAESEPEVSEEPEPVEPVEQEEPEPEEQEPDKSGMEESKEQEEPEPEEQEPDEFGMEEPEESKESEPEQPETKTEKPKESGKSEPETKKTETEKSEVQKQTPHRNFPWTPFLLFILTVLLAVTLALTL